MSICRSILDQTVTLGQLRDDKNRADSIFLLFNFIYLWFFFHKKLIPIESNGEDPCSIFPWAQKAEKVENVIASIPNNRIVSFLSISKTAKKLAESCI